jgi:hypothetical protein
MQFEKLPLQQGQAAACEYMQFENLPLQPVRLYLELLLAVKNY